MRLLLFCRVCIVFFAMLSVKNITISDLCLWRVQKKRACTARFFASWNYLENNISLYLGRGHMELSITSSRASICVLIALMIGRTFLS